MPRIEIPEDPKEKLEVFKKNLIIPDPSRVRKNPNSIEELLAAETLKKIIEYRMQLELEKDFRRDFEHQVMFGGNDILSKSKQYPLSQPNK